MPKLPSLTIFAVVLFIEFDATAADLGLRFDSYRDMHAQTPYGSLFFNQGAIRHRDDLSFKRFVVINGNGALDSLPSQQGYCFVFNHFDSPDGNSKVRTYRAKISKLYSDGTSNDEVVQNTFKPASEDWTSGPPDVCVSSIGDVTKVAITFSSDDGSFNRNISFPVKQ
jgi:hypothetical protein